MVNSVSERKLEENHVKLTFKSVDEEAMLVLKTLSLLNTVTQGSNRNQLNDFHLQNQTWTTVAQKKINPVSVIRAERS